METECVLSLGDQRWTLPTGPDDTDTVTIGRASNADIRLQADDQISRIHARLTRTAGTWTLHDESRNGTGLNGHRITAPTPLTTGDRIHIGRSILTFHRSTTPSPTTSPLTPDTPTASPPPSDPPHSPEPADAAYPPEPADAAYPPEPADAAYSPEPADVAHSPEPADAAYSPEPAAAAYSPEPAAAAYSPEPADAAYSPEPADVAHSSEPADAAYSPEPAAYPPAAPPPHPGEPADPLHSSGHATPANFQPPPAAQPYGAGDPRAAASPLPAPDARGGYGAPAGAGGSAPAHGDVGEAAEMSPFASSGYGVRAGDGHGVPVGAGDGPGVPVGPGDGHGVPVGAGDGPGVPVGAGEDVSGAGAPGVEMDRGWAAYPSADSPEPVRSPWEISARIDQSQPNWNESDGWPASTERRDAGDRRASGADRRTPGADRRTSGADRRTSGADRRATAADRGAAGSGRDADQRGSEQRGARLPDRRAADGDDAGPMGTVRLGRVLVAAGAVIGLGLIVNLVVTFFSDGPSGALRWLVPPGLALVVGMVIALLDAAAPKDRRPGRFDVSVVIAIVVVLVGIGVGGFALTAGTEYVAGYLTGNESGADRLVKPVAKPGAGVTITVENVTYTSHFTRIEVLIANGSKQAFTIPIDGTTFTAADGTALRADTGKSSWPSRIPAGGSEHGTITFKGHLPDSADQAVLTFKSGPTSFAVSGILLTN